MASSAERVTLAPETNDEFSPVPPAGWIWTSRRGLGKKMRKPIPIRPTMTAIHPPIIVPSVRGRRLELSTVQQVIDYLRRRDDDEALARLRDAAFIAAAMPSAENIETLRGLAVIYAGENPAPPGARDGTLAVHLTPAQIGSLMAVARAHRDGVRDKLQAAEMTTEHAVLRDLLSQLDTSLEALEAAVAQADAPNGRNGGSTGGQADSG